MMTSASVSTNYVDEFRVEIFSIFFIVGLSEFLLIHFLTDSERISCFFCGFHFSGNCDEISKDIRAGVEEEREAKREKRRDGSVSRGEVGVVLKRLGMFWNDGGAKLPESFDADDMFELFEEENPRLGEVREAFDVFDEDRNGFIEAEELQKVLEALGIREGLKLENCREMIAEVDDDGDGRIDFHEFNLLLNLKFPDALILHRSAARRNHSKHCRPSPPRPRRRRHAAAAATPSRYLRHFCLQALPLSRALSAVSPISALVSGPHPQPRLSLQQTLPPAAQTVPPTPAA